MENSVSLDGIDNRERDLWLTLTIGPQWGVLHQLRRFDYIRALFNLSAITSSIESMRDHHADGLPMRKWPKTGR
jgi:hypothetical protein